ncbi:MAG: alpha/beta hydrolase [Thermoproteota archaeon]|nr:alpha/beta hydrolase [Thermoproteota archaeon]
MDRSDKARSTLLLLHGTGGNEDDLLPLGRELDPNAQLLSPRGKILEGGRMPRFFRRLDEGVFDVEDLKFRTYELAGFVEKASRIYGFDARKVIAVGYSNGANIAASMLLLKPQTLSGAILFRAMVPLVPESLPNLLGKRIFMSSGLRDPIATREEAEKLSGLLRQARAVVDLQWQNSGHELTQEDIDAAKQWLVLNKKQL